MVILEKSKIFFRDWRFWVENIVRSDDKPRFLGHHSEQTTRKPMLLLRPSYLYLLRKEDRRKYP